MVFLGLGRETFLSSPSYQIVRSLFRNRQDSLFLLTIQSFSLQIIIYIIIMDTVAKVAKLRDPTEFSGSLRPRVWRRNERWESRLKGRHPGKQGGFQKFCSNTCFHTGLPSIPTSAPAAAGF